FARLPIAGYTSAVLKGGSAPAWGFISGADITPPFIISSSSYGGDAVIQGINGGNFLSNGVHGKATYASGQTYGVLGESASASGYGVYGWASSATGNTVGGYFSPNSPMGIGVQAYGLYNGGYFVSNSSAGVGVVGA